MLPGLAAGAGLNGKTLGGQVLTINWVHLAAVEPSPKSHAPDLEASGRFGKAVLLDVLRECHGDDCISRYTFSQEALDTACIIWYILGAREKDGFGATRPNSLAGSEVGWPFDFVMTQTARENMTKKEAKAEPTCWTCERGAEHEAKDCVRGTGLRRFEPSDGFYKGEEVAYLRALNAKLLEALREIEKDSRGFDSNSVRGLYNEIARKAIAAAKEAI